MDQTRTLLYCTTLRGDRI